MPNVSVCAICQGSMCMYRMRNGRGYCEVRVPYAERVGVCEMNVYVMRVNVHVCVYACVHEYVHEYVHELVVRVNVST